jgi:hypothetical protein
MAEGKPKSEARLENEDDFPNGFPLRDGKKHIREYICVAPGWDYIAASPGTRHSISGERAPLRQESQAWLYEYNGVAIRCHGCVFDKLLYATALSS